MSLIPLILWTAWVPASGSNHSGNIPEPFISLTDGQGSLKMAFLHGAQLQSGEYFGENDIVRFQDN